MRLRILLAGLAVCLSLPLSGFAQNPTGTISGHVSSADGNPLPGVTVSASSPNLQGIRTVVTTDNGDYILPLLSPGEYTITFELSGFQTAREVRNVAATQTVPLDVTMSLAPIVETVTVIGKAEPFVQAAVVATNFKQDLIGTLPTNRTLDASILMAPSVHPTGPGGRYSVNGSQSYENVYMINGVVVNENLRAELLSLWIEDAIQEVTVSTAGVSAEYGRFGGGLVNAITKSGGNIFSGSFRTSFNNDYWRTYTPYESTQRATNPSLQTKTDKRIPTYEFTFGGPVKKDQVWFFGAGRVQNQESTRQTVVTNIPYTFTEYEKRFEGKLTYSLNTNHSVKGSYTAIRRSRTKTAFQNVMELAGLTDRTDPQDLLSLHYSGLLTRNFTVEGQYSARYLTFKGSGSKFTDLIKGTLLIDRSRGGTSFRYWSPTFCGVCDNEKRDNENVVVKGSYFLSTNEYGAHRLVFGYDGFNDKRFANNHQSGSDWRILGTSTVIQGTTIYPVFLNSPLNNTSATQIWYTPIELSSLGTNFRTHSLFLNDSWRYNGNFSFNLGVRWDKNHGKDAAGTLVAKDSKFSPRLGLIWDPKGDGRWSVSGSYARYVTAISNSIADNSPAGQNSTFEWLYQGPSINADPTGPLVPSDVAIQRIFDWFNANGGRSRPTIVADVPGVSTRIVGSLDSPNVNEYAGGVSRQLGSRGSVRVDAVYRNYRDFYSTRTDLSTGQVTDKIGRQFDFNVVENTNDVKRRYTGLATQATYRFGQRIDLGGNYTLSHAWGNFDGENSASGPLTAAVHTYPEYRQARWNYPEGDLSIDQRHRVRLWGTYAPPFPGQAGSLNIGVLEQIGSGVPYGAVATIDPKPYVTNPGYLNPPSVSYFFTARDAFRTQTDRRTDLAVNYSYRVPGARSTEVFFHGEVLNMFNEFHLCGCGGTVFGNGGGADLTTIGQGVRVLQPFNPFTDTPVKGVNWDFNPNFGTPSNRFAYTSPRTFRFNVGVRF